MRSSAEQKRKIHIGNNLENYPSGQSKDIKYVNVSVENTVYDNSLEDCVDRNVENFVNKSIDNSLENTTSITIQESTVQ